MKETVKKNIRVSEETHRRLLEHGRKGETFDDVISRLLNDIEECNRVRQKLMEHGYEGKKIEEVIGMLLAEIEECRKVRR